jgi:hypothetical protein
MTVFIDILFFWLTAAGLIIIWLGLEAIAWVIRTYRWGAIPIFILGMPVIAMWLSLIAALGVMDVPPFHDWIVHTLGLPD